jgi:hypothetical protein
VRHRQASQPLWLLIRRTLDRTPEVKYYLANAAWDTPLWIMTEITTFRWRVEDSLWATP